MKISLSLFLLVGTCLSGAAYAESVHTVDWYQIHTSTRMATLSECRNNPGELGKTPNCINAEKADALPRHAPTVIFPKGTKPLEGKDFDFSYGR